MPVRSSGGPSYARRAASTCWNVNGASRASGPAWRSSRVPRHSSHGRRSTCSTRRPGALAQLDRVAQREPAQVRGVVDALGPPRPGAAGERRVGGPVGGVGERDHRAAAGLEQPRVALERAPRVDEVLEHVGGDEAVEAAEVARDVLDVADHDAVAALLARSAA